MTATGERLEVRAPPGRTAAAFVALPRQEMAAPERVLTAGLSGEAEVGRQARALLATDASPCRQVPVGVVTPRAVEVLVETARTCRARGRRSGIFGGLRGLRDRYRSIVGETRPRLPRRGSGRCREQIEQESGRRTMHLAEPLAARML